MNKFQVGDVLANDGFDYDRIVQGSIGEIIFTIDSDDMSANQYSIKELELTGWKLRDNSAIKEVTLEEVARAMNIPVGQLRIKKEN